MKTKAILLTCLCSLLISACAFQPSNRARGGESKAAQQAAAEQKAQEQAAKEQAAREEAARKAAEEEAAREAAKAAGPSYDARLSDYEYPYPVQTFELDTQNQQLEMIYMDISPEEAVANGQTVLLLHGKNFSGAYWKSTIEALVEQGYRVVAPDQIGFGKSSKPDYYQYSFHALADNTKRLLDELGVDQVSVVGHSMGGMLATRFALMYPDSVQKLALVNPIGLEDWKLKVPYNSVGEWYERELAKTPEQVKNYMTESYFDGQWEEDYEPLVEIQQGWIRGPEYERIAWNSALTYDMIFTQPVLYEFGDLSMPTLLIIGERDRTALGKGQVSPQVRQTLGQYGELGDKAAAAIPNATLVELPGVGHIPQYEAYGQYIKALEKFLPAGQ